MNLGKKHKNRILSLVLALTMVFSSFTVVSANTSDISGHWGEAVLQKWIDLGMLNGYANNQYQPNGSITRSEFVTLLNKMNNNTQTSDEIKKYTDVKATDWYYNEISKALAAGYISGTSNSTVSPTKLITREEAAAIVVKSKDIAPSSKESILSLTNDGNTASTWAKGYLAAAIEEGYISGNDGNIYPTNNLTRAEAIALLDKVLTDTRTYSFPTTYGPETGTATVSNVIVNNPDVTLCNMTINGDLEITEAVGEGDVTLENVSIKGNAYVKGGGEHTVLFNNVDVAGALVVNKLDGKIRILATGNTNISVTTLSSGAILVERELTGGGFETVTIPAEIAANQAVVIEGNVDRFENQAEGLDLTINGTVKELSSDHSLKVGGEANILKTTPTDGAQITSDKTPTTPNSNTSGGNGSSNTGSSSSDSSDDSSSSKKKNVTSVSINESDATLIVGETKTFTATVLPSYASDKSVQWSSSDTAVATVDANGMVSAVSKGTAIITVTTVNGGKTDFVKVTVKKPSLTLALSLLTNDKWDKSTGIPDIEEYIKKSVNFEYKGMLPSAEENLYYAAYVEDVNVTTSSTFLPVIVTVSDEDGPLTSTVGTTPYVNSAGLNPAAYGFGEYLAEGYKDGSILMLFDTSQKAYNMRISDDRYENVDFKIYLAPSNKPLLDEVGDITGTLEVGQTLTVGEAKADGSPITSNLTYQWFVSDNGTDNFEQIPFAQDSTYTVTQEESGKYFKVEVYGDNENVFGQAVTNSYGPVAQSADMQAIFAEIESLYLGQNADANYVNKDLNLMTALTNYPNVSIAWTSDNSAVNAQTGEITRGQDDVTVKLTATISGVSKEFEVKILSNKVSNVGQSGTDARFAAGYPRAFVEGGTIHVEFKTVSPAKVYMLVNGINGHQESSVEGVIGGYGGEEDQLVMTNSWPYFETQADQLVSFDTEVSVSSGNREKRIDFVLENMDGSNRGNLVEILFDKATVAALDQTGPDCEAIKINRDNSKLYVYFDENITTTGLSASDFSLSSGGTVTGILDVKNFDNHSVVGDGCIILSVTGASTASRLSYTGSAIKDTSINTNSAQTFSNKEITSAETSITDVVVGNDGKSVMVEIKGGPNNQDKSSVELSETDFVMYTANGNKNPSEISYSFNADEISFELKFDNALVIDSNSKIIVSMNKSGLFDYAYDTYSSAIEKEVTNDLSGISDKTPLSVTYNKAAGKFDLTFDSDLTFDFASYADNFVVEIDNTEYRLRGQLLRHNGNIVTIELLKDSNDNYSKKIKDVLSTASSVEIKYDLIHGDNHHQLLDKGASLLPAFGYEDVTINSAP